MCPVGRTELCLGAEAEEPVYAHCAPEADLRPLQRDAPRADQFAGGR